MNDRQVREAAATRRSVAPACVALYLAVVLLLLFAILHRDDHVFTYTLDDPYIHLALAENLSHGHYGINPGEASSPASSIVWPFLLAPAARWAWDEYLPLALNVLFCGIAAWWIGRLVDGWAWQRRPPVWPARYLMAVVLMLAANLAGLTFVGMEHGLQVLLAVVCAAGVVKAFAGRPVPFACCCAAALGPTVRYEGFALVAAVGVVLLAQGRRSAALRMAAASLVGPALFSLFLLSRGLPALPTSVLVKARAYSLSGGGAMAAVWLKYWGPNVGTMREYGWWALFAVAVVLAVLAIREKVYIRRAVLSGALLAAGLQLAIGQFNWFHRYEVYAVAFTVLVMATAVVESTRWWRIVLLAGIAAVALPYAQALWQTPAAASNVYQQQYQMHRFVADFYRGPVAVNDLGWVSYRRPASVRVLDLWGLASPEASREPDKDANWLDDITSTHATGLAILYPDWYEEGAPEDWDPLATLCITSPLTSVARRCVVFYRTPEGDRPLLRKEMADFARTLPASVKLTLDADLTVQPHEPTLHPK